jgi:4-hydroxybenzoate polyprenyltransferase
MVFLFDLFRVREYSKNFFIFLPLFFGVKFNDPSLFLKSFVIFVLFSMLTSAVYLLNDRLDLETDRKHPRKKNRPLASGKISKSFALVLCLGLASVSLILGFFWKLPIGLWMSAYLVINLFYSFGLKQVPIVDIFMIASGFVIRLYLGTAATGMYLSHWIILMTFLLALFLGLAKRRADLVLVLGGGENLRASIKGYSLEFVNGAMILMAAVTLVCYIMYSVDDTIVAKYHSRSLFPSVIFVLFGILRWLQISFVQNHPGTPTDVLLGDRLVLLSIVLWLGYFGFLIYWPHPNL